MKAVFIADAHLLDPEDANYRRLLAFLHQQRGSLSHLVLLGDIFEFWLGYRHSVFAPFVPLLEELRRQRAAGTELVFVEGNHDFHLGPYFSETLACRILPDGGVLELDGRLWTPARSCGLLAGAFRDHLIAEGGLSERIIHRTELTQARSVRLINSVRKWMDVELVERDRPASSLSSG